MLKELLTIDRITVLQGAENWETAIRLAAKPLLDCDAITEGYVDCMVQTVKDVGPYIVIDQDLAMPHARPEAGAIKPAMSLLILKSPVDMLGESVKVLLALSAVDATSHIEAMGELAKIVWNGCNAAVLSEANTPEEALSLLDQYALKEEGA